MSTALYRRYRPERFADVIGQEHVTDPLRQALRSGRVNHAYLFSGPRGCGKTTSARILARCLNCEQGPTDEPCGECDSCVALARGGLRRSRPAPAAGPGFVAGVRELGISLFLWGIFATSVPLILALYIGKYVFRFDDALVLGCCAGARTTTAALGMITDRAKSQIPALGYTVTPTLKEKA